MVNILSFSKVRNKYRITLDTDVEAAINIHLEASRVMKFDEVRYGLYVVTGNKHNNTKKLISGYSFLNLVSSNKSKFTRREIEGAERAQYLLRKLGFIDYHKY